MGELNADPTRNYGAGAMRKAAIVLAAPGLQGAEAWEMLPGARVEYLYRRV